MLLCQNKVTKVVQYIMYPKMVAVKKNTNYSTKKHNIATLIGK